MWGRRDPDGMRASATQAVTVYATVATRLRGGCDEGHRSRAVKYQNGKIRDRFCTGNLAACLMLKGNAKRMGGNFENR